MGDIGGVGRLKEFTELLKNCKIKSEDEITDDTDWRIPSGGMTIRPNARRRSPASAPS